MKTRYVALALAATMGLGSVSAFAQDHHRDGRGQQAWQQRGDRDWGHNQRFAAPRYYAPSYGYRRDNGDVAGALILGALTGALVGQAANNYNAPPATYYGQPPVTYYNPPATYYSPPATYYNPGYGSSYYGN
jgi:hypothetical protein